MVGWTSPDSYCLSRLSSDMLVEFHYVEIEARQVQKAWLELYKLPTQAKRDEDKQHLRKALANLYVEQKKAEQANFIRDTSDRELAELIAQIETGLIADFPPAQPKKEYTVTKQESGTLTFNPLWGCTGAFSIPPQSPHYQEASKHVGALKVGEVKEVPRLPFALSSNELVVMPDVPEKK